MFSTLAPSVSKIRLTFAFWSAKPNWMPRNPKLMFQICQYERVGLVVIWTSGVARVLESADQGVDLGVLEDLFEQPPHGALPIGSHRGRRAREVHAFILEPEILEPRNHERALRPAEPLEQIGQQGPWVRAVEAPRERLPRLCALLLNGGSRVFCQEAVPYPLADVVAHEPSGEGRRIVRTDERHIPVGRRRRELAAFLAAPILELCQVHPPDPVARERLIDLGRHVAEVLTHHLAVRSEE